MKNRAWAMSVLQSESSLNEIVQLVGKDSLSPDDQLTLETAKMIREDFLQQNAFVDVDSYSSYDRQERILRLILDYDTLCRGAIAKGARTQELFDIPMREAIGRAKSVAEDLYVENFARIREKMEREIDEVAAKGGMF
jgi:V/A-type H+-transporting ATPase subunit A